MEQTIIYLVRHGQTEWNLERRMQGHKNSPLTQLGVTQAQKLHDRIIKEKIDIIYSSESERAYNTAKIIRGNLNIPIITKSELREIHMGEWEGMKQTDIIYKYPEAWNNFWNNPQLFTPSGLGESYQTLKNRTIPTIENIINSNRGKTIIVVTHRITLKVIMAYFKNQQIRDIANNSDIEPASLCKVCIENDIPKILLYGDISHY